MSGTQLERSVLEAKEREELFAIADALGAKPTARAKKSDLVNQILRATGVEPEPEPEAPAEAKPRRTRARKAVAAPELPAEEDASEAASTVDTTTSGRAADATRSESDESGASDTRGVVATALGPRAPTAARGVSGPGRASAVNGSTSTSTSPASATAAAPATAGVPIEVTDRDRSDDVERPRLRNEPGEPSGGAGQLTLPGHGAPTGTGEGTDGGGGRGFEPEPGNRRNRRRRGRDRFSGERDLPGQSSETQYNGEPIPVSGYLDMREEGFGFLRTSGFLSGPGDVYVSISQVRRFALRKGDYLEGAARPAGGNEKYPALLRIDKVSGLTPDEARSRPRFENLTPLFPDQKLRLEIPGDPGNQTARIVDLISPIGKGQRGMIVSPPKAGKTTVLKQIARSIEANNPDVHLMVLLVDERPEEVTDMRRSIKGEVIASTFDRPAEEHTQVAELAIERAKRMVEQGKDVVIVLDGITRLARAYNLAHPATGRIMSGGIDTGALYPPKKFFGAARNIEEGGSLTILATALVETGSRMDEVIFEEFKGTGNMELRLDRKLAERRIYPALDVNASSTRHEELLFSREQLQQVWKLRRVLNALASEGSSAAGLELLLDRLKATRNNDEFLAEVAKNATPAI
jgi:transcription termination factor Rho